MTKIVLDQNMARKAFRVIAYGRGSLARLARLTRLDRRTCRRLFNDWDAEVDVVRAVDPKALDLHEWYAMFYPMKHYWTCANGFTHFETGYGKMLRNDLQRAAWQILGPAILPRLLDDWKIRRRKVGTRFITVKDLEQEWMARGYCDYDTVNTSYHFPLPDPSTFDE